MTATATAPARTASPARGSTLAGTGTLIRFILRRDRVRLPVWIGAITLFTYASVAALPDIYLDAQDRAARADLMINPGTRAISGPGYGLDDYTFGAMIAHEYFSWIAIFAALMSILLMVRHTRAEEETGRAELVRATVVGRYAPLTAAVVVVGGAGIALGALLALTVGSLGLESVTQESSLLFGAAIAMVALVFAAVTAATAQVYESGRAAGGLAGAIFGLAFVLRAAGDMSEIGGGFLSWLSPIGWGQQTRMYVDDRWWPLALSVALTVVLLAMAYWLSARRDVGAGLVQSRPGAASAGPSLSSPLGLAWRLHRTSMLWWTVALAAFGLGYGGLAGEVESFAEDFSAAQDLIEFVGGDSMINAFLATILSLVGVLTAVFAVLTVLRPRNEETSGRAEPVLATATSRTRWLAGHVVIGLAGSVFILALAGLGMGIAASSTLEENLVPDMLGAAVAYAPAVWVTIGLGVALYGWVPRATLLVWLLIAYAGLIGSFAAVLQLPEWTLDLSPFGHVPAAPAVDLTWTPLVVLTAIAAALIAAGFYGFRRRDLETK